MLTASIGEEERYTLYSAANKSFISFHNWFVFLHVIVVVSLTGSNTALMSWACITSGAPWSSATTEFTGIIDIKNKQTNIRLTL